MKRAGVGAAVEKIEESASPRIFSGTASWGVAFKSPLLRHVGTSYARSDFLFYKKSVTRSTVPPLSQKVTLSSPVRLQARSQWLAVATNFLRVRESSTPTSENPKISFLCGLDKAKAHPQRGMRFGFSGKAELERTRRVSGVTGSERAWGDEASRGWRSGRKNRGER